MNQIMKDHISDLLYAIEKIMNDNVCSVEETFGGAIIIKVTPVLKIWGEYNKNFGWTIGPLRPSAGWKEIRVGTLGWDTKFKEVLHNYTKWL